jgi:hypothetical protein
MVARTELCKNAFMMYFVSGDRVRHVEPPFQTGTINKIDGQTVWVGLDNQGTEATFMSDKLELFDAGPPAPADPSPADTLPAE